MSWQLITLTAAAVLASAAIIRAFRRDEELPTVRVRDGILCVGERQIPVTEIRQVSIAPLYDVAPGDDCWIVESLADNEVTFLGRDSGVSAALDSLQIALNGFNTQQCLTKAHSESVFEHPVVVWSIPQGH